MIFYDEEARERWEAIKEQNCKFFYGKMITDYAVCCMELLEKRLSEGEKLAEIWKDTLFKATGARNQSAYSASSAHRMIANFWIYGKDFKRLGEEIYNYYSTSEWHHFFTAKHEDENGDGEKYVYELNNVYRSYPNRKTRIGLFQNVNIAEKQIYHEIKESKKYSYECPKFGVSDFEINRLRIMTDVCVSE
ncbi:hypothetical protein [Listeria seeligeri]|uniref:hypothetical protein n=1 Tax=Listeria seeligeri TaxID=1640 RepID=UPI0022EC0A04|nr:hypothetical protein [Listeria seeligeri]